MSEELLEVQSQIALCRDPECIDPATGQRSIAEPEQDGEMLYYECQVCGYEFGYERMGEQQEGSCAIGVPEDVRRAASASMERSIAAAAPTPVSIGRKP